MGSTSWLSYFGVKVLLLDSHFFSFSPFPSPRSDSDLTFRRIVPFFLSNMFTNFVRMPLPTLFFHDLIHIEIFTRSGPVLFPVPLPCIRDIRSLFRQRVPPYPIVKTLVVNAYDLNLLLHLSIVYHLRSKECQPHSPMSIRSPLPMWLATSLSRLNFCSRSWVHFELYLGLPMCFFINTYIPIRGQSHVCI